MALSKKLVFGIKKAQGVPEVLASAFLNEMLLSRVPMDIGEHAECAIQAGILAERHKDETLDEMQTHLPADLDPRNFLGRYQFDLRRV